MDIEGWLRSLGLERYEAAFRENEIDEAVPPNLTAEDLKDLGVGIVGHRRKLIGTPCAPECDAYARPIEQPAYGEMNDAFIVIFLCEAIEPFGRGDILEKTRQLEFGIVATQIVSGEARIGIHAPGK